MSGGPKGPPNSGMRSRDATATQQGTQAATEGSGRERRADHHDATEPAKPLLRIVSGNPTPEEVAALVAVLAASGGGEAPAPRRTPAWSRPAAPGARARRRPGPGGWRASGLPR